MASPGDIIKTRFITNVTGQQCQFARFWQIGAILGVDTLTKVIIDLAQLYWDSVSGQTSPSVTFTAITWENQSQNEKQIVYPNLPGLGGSNPHSPFSVVRMNIWGEIAGPPVVVKRNAINVSGIRESNSEKGVLARGSYMNLLRAFLAQQATTAPTGMELNPQVRWRTAVGPPATYDYAPVTQVQENSALLTLRSRRPGQV